MKNTWKKIRLGKPPWTSLVVVSHHDQYNIYCRSPPHLFFVLFLYAIPKILGNFVQKLFINSFIGRYLADIYEIIPIFFSYIYLKLTLNL
jgi:hypothetical protein